MIDYPIVSEITLTPGVRRIDIHTSVENSAKDHRLRVTFPLPYSIQTAAAEGTFEVRVRPIAAPRPADVAEWIEEPVNTFPQKRFVDASNGTIGLGVLNRGLPEYEIIPNGSGQLAVAVTLLRCVEWLSRGDLSTRKGDAGPQELTPEAQCLGHHEFDYALVPHSGDWEAEEALVLREAQAFNTPVRALVTEQHEGQLPSQSTLIEVEPPALVVSAIKQSEAGNGSNCPHLQSPEPYSASHHPTRTCLHASFCDKLKRGTNRGPAWTPTRAPARGAPTHRHTFRRNSNSIIPIGNCKSFRGRNRGTAPDLTQGCCKCSDPPRVTARVATTLHGAAWPV